MSWILLFVTICFQNTSHAQSLSRYQGARRCMGVTWTVTVFTETLTEAETAITAALNEVTRLEKILSDYEPNSELCQLSASAPTQCPKQISNDLWEVLVQAVAWRDRSRGAFDPTVGVLTDLWRKARQTGRMPLPEELSGVKKSAGPETLRLDDAHRVSLLEPNMRLDLGGIGMGFAIDQALRVVKKNGISIAMIDASGDIGVIGKPPHSNGWRIAIDALGRNLDKNNPALENGFAITLEDASVTTSGDAFQAIEIGGTRYSHIVDPRTGLGVIGSTGVTVIAADATTADAVATTLSVLGPDVGCQFVDQIERCAARFIWKEDGQVRVRTTSKWPSQTTGSLQNNIK
ncbi:MAG: FAD:protein FMN transferase [Planctomycetaceae bacterium]|nr:FAD:protein FMN transferase [Planctomycetaceae bacterium]MBT6055099.1 FAD:protein FMN transferase [Planctomycetaceae bacterium]MBT6458383.1 FAD:protein FMN transferase [Planctomycetaceae bacterium]MBT7729519.1 FAD:protein FMN transferase [Planctomycetaceae bacterium]